MLIPCYHTSPNGTVFLAFKGSPEDTIELTLAGQAFVALATNTRKDAITDDYQIQTLLKATHDPESYRP